jgi:hypothetical protein
MHLPSRSWVYDFIYKHERIKLLKPIQLGLAQIRASLKSNVKSWLDKIHYLITKRNYEKDLIIQVDETSCLVHSHQRGKKVVDSTIGYLPTLCKPPIVHLTCVFGINALGGHVPTQLLVPACYPIPGTCLQRFPDLKVGRTSSGWMTKQLWEDYVKGILFPEIERIRKALKDGEKPALLIIDGHSSRINRQLWELCALLNIDVILIPAHTSHILQPLDLTVNGVFKTNLEGAHPFHTNSKLDAELEPFLFSLMDAI